MPTIRIVNDQGDLLHDLSVEGGASLYDSITSQNVAWPHGCLAGSCGACRTEILEGSEGLSPVGVVEQNTLDSIRATANGKADHLTIRLACRARIQGDVTIRPFRF